MSFGTTATPHILLHHIYKLIKLQQHLQREIRMLHPRFKGLVSDQVGHEPLKDVIDSQIGASFILQNPFQNWNISDFLEEPHDNLEQSIWLSFQLPYKFESENIFYNHTL